MQTIAMWFAIGRIWSKDRRKWCRCTGQLPKVSSTQLRATDSSVSDRGKSLHTRAVRNLSTRKSLPYTWEDGELITRINIGDSQVELLTTKDQKRKTWPDVFWWWVEIHTQSENWVFQWKLISTLNIAHFSKEHLRFQVSFHWSLFCLFCDCTPSTLLERWRKWQMPYLGYNGPLFQTRWRTWLFSTWFENRVRYHQDMESVNFVLNYHAESNEINVR